ncbi:MAG: hypothetical protein DU480_14530 [Nitrosomonas sp.]|uniref:hypothetical protein n=1 Tax=Nitrosomonas sp. TaxID=42353 RepID=UPI0032EE0044
MTDFSRLQNIYWRIRYQRNRNLKRKYYRYAADEKKRLLDAGVDPEELRLMWRTLAKQHCEHAERHLKTYRSKVTEKLIFS